MEVVPQIIGTVWLCFLSGVHDAVHWYEILEIIKKVPQTSAFERTLILSVL